MNAEDINWETIEYNDKAALCFIVTGNKILLIRKKKGLGTGKMDAPGGRIEPGETEYEAVCRELMEELCIVPKNPVKKAELRFHFTSGYTLYCSVFTATVFSGKMKETDEAAPFWFFQATIPYHQMWEDNRLWLPEILAGKTLKGYFLFDDEKMMSSRIIAVPEFRRVT